MGRYSAGPICDGLTSVDSDGACPGGAGICPWPRGVARPSDFSLLSECTQREVLCVLSMICIKACTRFSLIARLDAAPLHGMSTVSEEVDSGNLTLTLGLSGFWCHIRFWSLCFPFAAWDTAVVCVAPPGRFQKKVRLDLHVAGPERAWSNRDRRPGPMAGSSRAHD